MVHASSKRRVFFQSAKVGMFFLPLAIFVSMFEFALPLRLDSIESSLSLIGLFISFSWIITTFLDFFWGDFVDKIGKKNGAILGIAIFGASTFLFAFTDNFWVLFAFNMIAYLGYDLFYISIQGYLVSTTPKKYFSYAASGFYPLWSLGFIFGPLISAYLITTFHYSYVYLAAALLCGITIFLIHFLVEKRSPSLVKHPMHSFISKKEFFTCLRYFKKLFQRDSWLLIGIMACTFWYSIMLVGIPLLFLIEENNIWLSALMLTAFIAPFVFTDFIVGFIAINKKRRFILITLGFLLGGCALIAFYLNTNFWLLAAAVALSTFGIDIAWTVFDIEAGVIAKRGEEGKIEGAFTFAKNLGWDTSPLFFGVVAQFLGARIPFLLLGIGVLFLAVIFLIRHKQIK